MNVRGVGMPLFVLLSIGFVKESMSTVCCTCWQSERTPSGQATIVILFSSGSPVRLFHGQLSLCGRQHSRNHQR